LTLSPGERLPSLFSAGYGQDQVTIFALTGAPELRRVIPALECEVTPDAAEMERFSRAARFDLGFVPHGYAWVFPKREHLSIGVLTTRRGAANLNQYYERYLDLLGIKRPHREERHGFMIPIRPREGARHITRVLFVGDAAGLADPILAEGITAAILSGQLAAEAIVRGHFADAAVKEAYRRELSGQLLPELRAARWLAWVLYDCPRVRSAFFSRHGASLCELVANVALGATTYSASVRRPKNYF
jgi:flavin-dependent dehydrogenase